MAPDARGGARQRRPGATNEPRDLELSGAASAGGGRPEDAPAASKGATADADADADADGGINLDGDRGNLALLLLLYTLQGVPMGLANSVTAVLAERGASYAAQGACRVRAAGAVHASAGGASFRCRCSGECAAGSARCAGNGGGASAGQMSQRPSPQP
jgi:hypothetical protein